LCLSGVAQESFTDNCYAENHARLAWVTQCLSRRFEPEQIAYFQLQELAEIAASDPLRFIGLIASADSADDILRFNNRDALHNRYPKVSLWKSSDVSRVLPLPRDHWLLVTDAQPFRASLGRRHVDSISANDLHVAVFSPEDIVGDNKIILRRLYSPPLEGVVRCLPSRPLQEFVTCDSMRAKCFESVGHTVLLTNDRGGMVRMAIDLGKVQSKYDCLLGANLHEDSPVDRHVFAKRLRLWAVADGLITPLNIDNLLSFSPGPPARWKFLVSAGDSRAVEVELEVHMPTGKNITTLHLVRPDITPLKGERLEKGKNFSLTVRIDVEDRSFHSETQLNNAVESFFENHISTNDGGFVFKPADDRRMEVSIKGGCFHSALEWCRGVEHSLEAGRGQCGEGDACSPGWFEVPLAPGGSSLIQLSAEPASVECVDVIDSPNIEQDYESRLISALQQFVVRRGEGQTVVAGYPWFLDWGRDTFIVARGLLSSGCEEDVAEIVQTFARLESNGTLPNTLNGDDNSNRETSDAPLWFSLVVEELGEEFLDNPISGRGPLSEVLISIGTGCRDGAQNGVKMDESSGLLWSPSHYTWMDTNYPAGSPREGYPIEIQALWVRLLSHLNRIDPGKGWDGIFNKAMVSIDQLFGGNNNGWISDHLHAEEGRAAFDAVRDDALRPNALIAIALGVVSGPVARKTVLAAKEHLIVPGAIRTLAPLPVKVPLEVRAADGRLLNDPINPYWGKYMGDEDTRRKPAYHNGTAWGWLFPVFCEALVKAWKGDPNAVRAARSYLLSTESLLNEGCLGHLPEIMDGDAPHRQRGCDAQAWSVSEALRVWNFLKQYE